MKILIACEYSGTVRDAFTAKGHNAISCDFEPTEKPGKHFQGDVTDILYHDWDMIIAHPPCTYLSNSGVRWLYNPDGTLNDERWLNMRGAADFFEIFLNHSCPRICIENPIPHKHAGLPAYTQTVQPYEFGHTTSKRTCLWLKGLPPLKPTRVIPKEERTQDIWLASPGPDRWKLRSRTFEGIASAMAEQWGNIQETHLALAVWKQQRTSLPNVLPSFNLI